MKAIDTSQLPINQAAENNKKPIFEVLQKLGLLSGTVLEVGSGTGQHGIYFCEHCPELHWQPTEIKAQLPVLQAWYDVVHQQGLANFFAPIPYAIEDGQLPGEQADALYCANVLHIIQREQAEQLIKQAVEKLDNGQLFIGYGPYKENGEFTTESNRDFHFWLQQKGYGGLLDIDDIATWSKNTLTLEHQINMPANNFLLVWQKVSEQ